MPTDRERPGKDPQHSPVYELWGKRLPVTPLTAVLFGFEPPVLQDLETTTVFTVKVER